MTSEVRLRIMSSATSRPGQRNWWVERKRLWWWTGVSDIYTNRQGALEYAYRYKYGGPVPRIEEFY